MWVHSRPLSCSVALFVWLCASTTLFELLQLCNLSWYWEVLFFLIRITFSFLGSVIFHVNIRAESSKEAWGKRPGGSGSGGLSTGPIKASPEKGIPVGVAVAPGFKDCPAHLYRSSDLKAEVLPLSQGR